LLLGLDAALHGCIDAFQGIVNVSVVRKGKDIKQTLKAELRVRTFHLHQVLIAIGFTLPKGRQY
jgi:hypothetical protein